MKKILPIIAVVLIASIISAFPGSKTSYASKSAFFSSAPGRGAYLNSIRPVRYNKPRDYRIPDDENENTPYGLFHKPLLLDEGSGSQFIISSWEGPKVVVIDPGHGGEDPGATVNGLVEKDINLDVSLRVRSILQSRKVLVLMTRESDLSMEPRDRIVFANSNESALFISIHSNWFEDPSLHGVMTLYYPSLKQRAGYLTGVGFALTVQQELMGKIQMKDRGIIDRPNLAVLRHADMPSILVEIGFMSNKEDARLLSSEEFRQKSAEGIAQGIIKALSKIDGKDK